MGPLKLAIVTVLALWTISVNGQQQSARSVPPTRTTARTASGNTNTRINSIATTTSRRSTFSTAISTASADLRALTPSGSSTTELLQPTTPPDSTNANGDGGDTQTNNDQIKVGVIVGVVCLVFGVIGGGLFVARRYRRRNRGRLNETSIKNVLALHRSLSAKTPAAKSSFENFGNLTGAKIYQQPQSRQPSMITRQPVSSHSPPSTVSGYSAGDMRVQQTGYTANQQLRSGRYVGTNNNIIAAASVPSTLPSPPTVPISRSEPASLGQNVGGRPPLNGGGQWLRRDEFSDRHRVSSGYYTHRESRYLYY